MLLNLLDLWGTTPLAKLGEIYHKQLECAASEPASAEKKKKPELSQRTPSVHFVEHHLEESFLSMHLREQRELVSCAVDTLSIEMVGLGWAESVVLTPRDILKAVSDTNDYLAEKFAGEKSEPPPLFPSF